MAKTWITSAHRGFTAEHMHENTVSAFRLAAAKGADMVETDARMTRDGILVACHDPVAKGFDEAGNPLVLSISETTREELSRLILAPDDPAGPQRVPLLSEILELAYYTGLKVNIDLKEGLLHAAETAELVCDYGMKGRVVYAANGAGPLCIRTVRDIDPMACFIDRPSNFTAEALRDVKDYRSFCFAYTADFSEENIRRIRRSGCMLAAISLRAETVAEAFRHRPDMAEYLHTSDFEQLEKQLPV